MIHIGLQWFIIIFGLCILTPFEYIIVFDLVEARAWFDPTVLTDFELVYIPFIQEFIHIHVDGDVITLDDQTVLDLGNGVVTQHWIVVRGRYTIYLNVYFRQVGNF